MKNKVSDVRDHLVAMLERLGDDDLSAEQMGQVIERAKASTIVATTYIGAVKVELDAIRLAHETGNLTAAVAEPQQLPTLPASQRR
ncbi:MULTISPECIES: hypothetical protein [Stenotrophomonas]|uniref:hypothetical protein n=1 Tax=Stenotrophomonas maltophilia group TaxID=995085 RepID=UPI0008103260|nr:hypothetical protein [Stenotrophomonas maltophilia]OCK48338.1 hypothetical protein BA766_20125 [Stenotrophomonas maltophilia]